MSPAPPRSAFTARERYIIETATTPERVQRWLESLPYNHEERGETHADPREEDPLRDLTWSGTAGPIGTGRGPIDRRDVDVGTQDRGRLAGRLGRPVLSRFRGRGARRRSIVIHARIVAGQDEGRPRDAEGGRGASVPDRSDLDGGRARPARVNTQTHVPWIDDR